MTLEEALERPVFCSKEVRDLVIEIFKDKEKEICINCKYYGCAFQDAVNKVAGFTLTDFGCSEFAHK